MRKINAKGLALIKLFESCRLKAYQDIVGVWTIGYGHTGPEVIDGMFISQDEADQYLESDLEKFYHLDQYLSEQVNDNQFSALVCLAFNIGLRALKLSTLMKCINNEDTQGIKQHWMEWNHAGGQVIAGLTKRRKAELDLFNELG